MSLTLEDLFKFNTDLDEARSKPVTMQMHVDGVLEFSDKDLKVLFHPDNPNRIIAFGDDADITRLEDKLKEIGLL